MDVVNGVDDPENDNKKGPGCILWGVSRLPIFRNILFFIEDYLKKKRSFASGVQLLALKLLHFLFLFKKSVSQHFSK